MAKLLFFTCCFCFAIIDVSHALVGGAGLEFEELIPRDSYDPNTIESVRGRVTEVVTIPKMTGMGNGIVLRFGSPTDSIYAIIAPDWYLKNQGLEIKENDLVSIVGSRITYKDKTVVIASEITFNGKTLHLRNEKTGNPEWSEWRKGEEIFYKNYKW